MAEHRQSGRALCDVKYHLVCITKYHYKILRGEATEHSRNLIRQLCQAREVVTMRDSVLVGPYSHAPVGSRALGSV